MASELTVQTIRGPLSGDNANKIIIPEGQTLDLTNATKDLALDSSDMPSGSVLQAVSVTYNIPTSGQYLTSTSTAFQALTPLTLSITPKSDNSKLIVDCTFNFDDESTSSNGVLGTLYRDGVNIADGGHQAMAFVYNSPASDNYSQVRLYKMIDSGSTSTTTFIPYVRNWNASSLRYMSHGGECTFTIMEIKQ